MTDKYNAIQDPTAEPESLLASVTALKENMEILTRQRRPVALAAVTWQDLVDLELITPDQVPSR